MIRREHTAELLRAAVPERLDRLEAPAQYVLGDRLHHDAAEPLALVLGNDQTGDELNGVGGDRAGGEGRRARHIGGRRIENEPRRDIVHIDHPAAGAPLQEHRGDPGFLLKLRLARLYRGFPADRVKLPEDACSAAFGEILKVVQGERYKPTPHGGDSSLLLPAASRAAASALRSWNRLPTNPPTAPRPSPTVTSRLRLTVRKVPALLRGRSPWMGHPRSHRIHPEVMRTPREGKGRAVFRYAPGTRPALHLLPAGTGLLEVSSRRRRPPRRAHAPAPFPRPGRGSRESAPDPPSRRTRR